MSSALTEATTQRGTLARALEAGAPLRRVLVEFRYRLFFTYSLFAVEMLALLLRPYFLGTAIDGLIQGSYTGLISLSIAHLGYLIIGTVRHMYDTRTFTAVFTLFVTRMLARTEDAANLSRRSAHATLARQVVDFLEHDVNYIVEALYNVIGSLILLFLYNRSVVGICLAVLVPVILLGRRYGRRAVQLNLEQYDELERQVDVISRRNADEIDLHFRRLRMWQVRLSDQEAWNFGATELLVLVAISGSLLVAAEPGHAVVQVGAIVGIYNYILKFASGLETIPYMIQRLGALKDILRRMSGVASNGADASRDMPTERKEDT
ncbi:ABC transporter six-transmembrane domain-containing protein [Gemmatimonas sp.]|uniref:ABC transporter six-transmembrane domain-containing protein n=1 Tax=Gemmatimonas sp. TaxID=1962908 RepID=UPI00356220C9